MTLDFNVTRSSQEIEGCPFRIFYFPDSRVSWEVGVKKGVRYTCLQEFSFHLADCPAWGVERGRSKAREAVSGGIPPGDSSRVSECRSGRVRLPLPPTPFSTDGYLPVDRCDMSFFHCRILHFLVEERMS